MSAENVKAYLESRAMIDRYIELDGSSATVALAAEQLNCEPARIAKTLAIKLKSGRLLVPLRLKMALKCFSMKA